MILPEVPMRLSLHTVSMHLLGAKTNWQNVQDEATLGHQTAHGVVTDYQKHRTVSVQTLRAYLAFITTAPQAWLGEPAADQIEGIAGT